MLVERAELCAVCGRDNRNKTHDALQLTGHLNHAFQQVFTARPVSRRERPRGPRLPTTEDVYPTGFGASAPFAVSTVSYEGPDGSTCYETKLFLLLGTCEPRWTPDLCH